MLITPPSPVATTGELRSTTVESDSIRSVLAQYADAYSRLDASAASVVWPSVDRSALARAFSGLSAQKVAFNDCAIDVQQSSARANCTGIASWEPRVGGSGVRTDGRRWSFDLRKSSGGWVIKDARVESNGRNR
jgi:hypothetical protein